MWGDQIGKTPHFLLWFWCDVSLALTPSWTLWGLLGIERLIGVFELGDLIECSCHNISNTVYSPIMTQPGRDGHVTNKTTRRKKKKEHFLRCDVLDVIYLFFSKAETPPATAALTVSCKQTKKPVSNHVWFFYLSTPTSFKWWISSDLNLHFLRFYAEFLHPTITFQTAAFWLLGASHFV